MTKLLIFAIGVVLGLLLSMPLDRYNFNTYMEGCIKDGSKPHYCQLLWNRSLAK